MPQATGIISFRERQVLVLDGNPQTVNGMQFWVDPPGGGGPIPQRLGYIQACVFVPSADLYLEQQGRSVWYQGVRYSHPPITVDSDSWYAVVFWPEVINRSWVVQYSDGFPV